MIQNFVQTSNEKVFDMSVAEKKGGLGTEKNLDFSVIRIERNKSRKVINIKVKVPGTDDYFKIWGSKNKWRVFPTNEVNDDKVVSILLDNGLENGEISDIKASFNTLRLASES